MEENTQRLSRSMRHWFEKAGIYQGKAYGLHRKWRRGNGYLLAKTRKARFVAGTRDGIRNFRVLSHLGIMQICDGYFDRWANSVGAEVPLPRTEAEFVAALDTLLRDSEARVRETMEEAA
jgi:hypothetical protein